MKLTLSSGCSILKMNINNNNDTNNIKNMVRDNHQKQGQYPSSPVGWRCSDVREREFTINLLELQ